MPEVVICWISDKCFYPVIALEEYDYFKSAGLDDDALNFLSDERIKWSADSRKGRLFIRLFIINLSLS